MPLPKAYISHSQLSTFEKCGEQYRRAYIEKERKPPGVAALRGSGVHGAAKLNFRQKLTSGTDLPLADLVDETATAFDRAADRGYMLTPEEEALGKARVLGHAKDRAVAMTTLMHRDLAPTIQPALVEEEITLTLPAREGESLQLFGVVDLATTNDVIHDLKTAGKKPTENAAILSTQLTWYALSFRALTGRWPAWLVLDVLVDTAVPTLVHRVSARDVADGAALAARIDNMIRAIEAQVFTPAAVGSWVCTPKWCGFFRTCRYVNAARLAAAEALDSLTP